MKGKGCSFVLRQNSSLAQELAINDAEFSEKMESRIDIRLDNRYLFRDLVDNGMIGRDRQTSQGRADTAFKSNAKAGRRWQR
jgi:hypothetical protein